MTELTLVQDSPLHIFTPRGNKSPLDMKIFLDEAGTVDISRSDLIKYPIFEKQAEHMFGAHWKWTEIKLARDKIDFYELTPNEQFIFTTNLKRQMMLDTQQSLGLAEALLPLCSNSQVKRCINYITFFEEMHNATYEYILKNVYNDPTEINNGIYDIQPILDCGASIGRYYDRLLHDTAKYRLGLINEHELKRSLWICVHSINALEGIRFFVSFACSFAFGASGRMVGNSSEIKLIANDELSHVAFTTALIRTLPSDDPEFKDIQHDMQEEVTEQFMEVVVDEKNFSSFLFKDGDVIGLNHKIMCSKIDHLAEKRMRSVYLKYPDPFPKLDPTPWMGSWLNEGDQQPAPQETEKTSYVVNIQNSISSNSFDEFEL